MHDVRGKEGEERVANEREKRERERERAKQNKYKSICVSVEHLRD